MITNALLAVPLAAISFGLGIWWERSKTQRETRRLAAELATSSTALGDAVQKNQAEKP